MPTYTFIRKIIRVQGKKRAFLVLKYNQKHIEFIETTLIKMHTDTVESPVLASRRPLWQVVKARAQTHACILAEAVLVPRHVVAAM